MVNTLVSRHNGITGIFQYMSSVVMTYAHGCDKGMVLNDYKRLCFYKKKKIILVDDLQLEE